MFSGSLTLSVMIFSTFFHFYSYLLDFQYIKTDTLNYILVIILFIINKENKVYLVIFYFYTFIVIKLNYNIYNKKLLIIFKVFKI